MLSAFSAGIGVSVCFLTSGSDAIPSISNIVPNGPADINGILQEGDLLVSIDGEPVAGWSLSRIQGAILGPEGTAVAVVVDRAGQLLTAHIRRGPPLPAGAAGHLPASVGPDPIDGVPPRA